MKDDREQRPRLSRDEIAKRVSRFLEPEKAKLFTEYLADPDCPIYSLRVIHEPHKRRQLENLAQELKKIRSDWEPYNLNYSVRVTSTKYSPASCLLDPVIDCIEAEANRMPKMTRGGRTGSALRDGIALDLYSFADDNGIEVSVYENGDFAKLLKVAFDCFGLPKIGEVKRYIKSAKEFWEHQKKLYDLYYRERAQQSELFA